MIQKRIHLRVENSRDGNEVFDISAKRVKLGSSGDREQYTPRTLNLVLRNMQRFIAGKPLTNRVSRKHQY